MSEMRRKCDEGSGGKRDSVVSVRYPEMRARMWQAVETLCDEELHARLWVRGEQVSPTELDFDDTLLVLVDELEMFPRSDLVGDVLLDDVELGAFEALVAAIDELLCRIGKLGTYTDALAEGSGWGDVLAAAASFDGLRRRER